MYNLYFSDCTDILYLSEKEVKKKSYEVAHCITLEHAEKITVENNTNYMGYEFYVCFHRGKEVFRS